MSILMHDSGNVEDKITIRKIDSNALSEYIKNINLNIYVFCIPLHVCLNLKNV